MSKNIFYIETQSYCTRRLAGTKLPAKRRVEDHDRPILEPSARQPPGRIGQLAAFARKGHYDSVMRGDGSGKEVGRGGIGVVLYSRKKHTLINHGGHCCPTTATGHHSRCQSIQQSANMLRDRSTLLKLENIIVITIFMTILGTTRRQIFVPDCCQVNRPYGRSRALRAKTEAHTRCICFPTQTQAVSLDNHDGQVWGLGN